MKLFGRGAPLFAQVLALVIVSMIAAHAVSTVVIFSLPPPPPEPYRLSEIARALRNPGVTTVPDARPLVVSLRDRPPRERPAPRRGHLRDEMRRALADSLGVDPSRVVIRMEPPHRMFVQAMRLERREARGPRHEPPPGPPPGAGQPPDQGPPPVEEPPGFRRVSPGLAGDRVVFAPFEIGLRQADGRWLVVRPKPSFQISSWQGHILITLLLSVLAIAPLAWLFARRVSAPIAAFASAADRLGRDPGAAPLELAGSTEVIAAAEAFNRMQERLRRYVEDRTAMVGAIAHDLRTPLTRLRFRIEAAPDDIRGRLAADIDQMDAMISAALGFVRDATRTGPRERLDVTSLVESLAIEAAETGSDVVAAPSPRLTVLADPLALRRLLANLIENALKYGERARARAFAEGDQAVIEIEDDGPGIPPDDLERVFEPFYRGEPSRNRETGGAGLGLAVVRSIARAHGGDVILRNRPGGGLTARVTLPL